MPQILLVGLGNPGPQYELTRHNLGFMFLDSLAQENSVSFQYQSKFKADIAKISWLGADIILAKPLTYMNLSGESVQAILHYHRIETNQLIVVFDDLDQNHGAVKMRHGGGHGGHNGIRSILQQVAKDDFYRVKIGIGKPLHKTATANWVLQKFSKTELEIIYEDSFLSTRQRIQSIFNQQR